MRTERPLATELQMIQGFEDAINDRVAEEIIDVAWGQVLFNRAVPAVRAFNFLRADTRGGPATAEELAATAHDVQGSGGISHRRISVADPDRGAALADDFVRMGWKVDRFLIMVYRGGRPDPPRGTRVREISARAYQAIHRKVIAEESPDIKPDVMEQLLAIGTLIAEAVDVRYFAALSGRSYAAACQLYSNGKIAQIEDVSTLVAYRRKGLSHALMRHVLIDALDAGHELIFLVADADDWPRDFYARLGFVDLAVFYEFVIPADTGYGWD